MSVSGFGAENGWKNGVDWKGVIVRCREDGV